MGNSSNLFHELSASYQSLHALIQKIEDRFNELKNIEKELEKKEEELSRRRAELNDREEKIQEREQKITKIAEQVETLRRTRTNINQQPSDKVYLSSPSPPFPPPFHLPPSPLSPFFSWMVLFIWSQQLQLILPLFRSSSLPVFLSSSPPHIPFSLDIRSFPI